MIDVFDVAASVRLPSPEAKHVRVQKARPARFRQPFDLREKLLGQLSIVRLERAFYRQDETFLHSMMVNAGVLESRHTTPRCYHGLRGVPPSKRKHRLRVGILGALLDIG